MNGGVFFLFSFERTRTITSTRPPRVRTATEASIGYAAVPLTERVTSIFASGVARLVRRVGGAAVGVTFVLSCGADLAAGIPDVLLRSTTSRLWRRSRVGCGHSHRGRNHRYGDRSRHNWVRGSWTLCHRWESSRCAFLAIVISARIVLVVTVGFPDRGTEDTKDDGQGNDVKDPKGFFLRVTKILDECASAGCSAHLVLFIVQIDRRGINKGDILVLWSLLLRVG